LGRKLKLVRPKTRGDCRDGVRPCPWVSCRHHLALDIHASSKTRGRENSARGVKLYRGELEDMPHTCSLDAADEGERGLHEIAALLGLTRERIRQISDVAISKLRAKGMHE
jgi:hypothetical protein